jgi:hypothetical protein
MRSATVLVAAAVVLACAGVAFAQGGVTAPDFTEPCPALYPGDEAEGERIARWMARAAADRGLPHELPVMAAIAESGLRNIRGGTHHGFFGMHRSLNAGDYRGFPRRPELQVKWFLDTAALVRQRLVAEGRADPARDTGSWGEWIADVERPAAHNRDNYQPHLAEARRLVGGRCAAPAAADMTPPRLFWRVARVQRALSAGGIALRVRCPDSDCLVGSTASIEGVARTLRAAAIEPPARSFATLTIRLPRPVRRALRGGERLRATISAHAADTVANVTTRTRAVTLVGPL